MKKIIVSQRIIENEAYSEIRDTLDVQWGNFLKELGVIPIILPSSYDYMVYFKELNIEGILLTGGNNLGAISKNSLNIKRDLIERKLIEYGINNSIPIIGVCRGMQILLDYFGYKLEGIENHVGTKHSIRVTRESKYYNELFAQTVVNSYHNYGITYDNFINNDLGLRASAISNDGIVEAIEHKNYSIFGQMWHPERNLPFNSTDIKLFKNHFGIK